MFVSDVQRLLDAMDRADRHDYWFAASTVSNGFERAVQPSLFPLSRWVCIVCIGLKGEKKCGPG